MDEIKRKRLDKKTSSREWTVEDCLEFALDDLKRGETKANKCLVLLINEEPDNTSVVPYRSNLNRVEEIGWIEMAKYRSLRRWNGDDE